MLSARSPYNYIFNKISAEDDSRGHAGHCLQTDALQK